MSRTGYMVRATAFDGRVRAFAIESTAVVDELQRRQATFPVATAALGRAATGALLLGRMMKDEDQLVTIRIKGGGPIGVVLVSANGKGEVRGLVGNPQPDIEQVRNGKLNVAEAVGTDGFLSVTKDLAMRESYSSAVEIVSGEVGEDLAYYLTRSEQIPSAVGIGVFVRPDGSVEAAGGYIVQIMGGLTEDETAEIEAMIRSLPHPTTMLRSGMNPEQILERVFPSGFSLLETLDVAFSCPCTRERAERALLLQGPELLETMLAEDVERGYTETVCQFCAEEYRFTSDDLQALIRSAA